MNRCEKRHLRFAVTGPVVFMIVGGLSALSAALFSIGIPKDNIVEYETQIKAGKFMVIAHGELDDMDKGMIALESVKHESVKQHALETAN